MSHVPDIPSTLIDVFKITKDVAESLEKIPYVKSLAGVIVQVLQIREEVEKNNEAATALIDDVHNRSRALFNILERYVEDACQLNSAHLRRTLKPLEEGLCQYQKLLERIYECLCNDKISKRGFRGSMTRIFGRESIKTQLESLRANLFEFDSTFLVQQVSHLRLDVANQTAHATALRTARERVLVTPPPPSRIFIGRVYARDHMFSAFFSKDEPIPTPVQKCYVLHGLGGAGKTQLALKFINDYKQKFTRIYMIDASSAAQIDNYLENIGIEAKISQSPRAGDTLRWLAGLQEDWLLLFDNADDPDINLWPCFPQCTHGNIIITTRNPQCITHAHSPHASWHVSDLTPEDAVALLFSSSRASGKDDPNMAEILARELGYLALALVQAGCFILRSPGLTFATYLDLLKANKARLLRQEIKQGVDSYTHTVYTTWEMSFEKLSPGTQTFLQICGFLHHEGIAVDIFKRAVSNLLAYSKEANEPLQQKIVAFLKSLSTDEGAWDQLAFLAIATELASYSLIQQSAYPTFSIHPLVHSWSQHRLSPEEKASLQQLAISILCLSITDDRDAAGFAHRRLLLPHMDAVLPYPLSKMNMEAADRFTAVYDVQCRWGKLEDLSRVTAKTRAGLFGEEHPEALKSKQQLAKALRGQGRHCEAEVHEVALVEQGKRAFGLEHADTLGSMVSLASTYRKQGRYSEAEPVELQALKVRKRVLGAHHPDTLSSMANLAATYHAQGRYDEARRLQAEALELRKIVLGTEHPDTLRSMASVASTIREQGQLTEAEALEVRILEVQTRVLGSEHPDTLFAMASLASTIRAQGRCSAAEKLDVQVLELRTQLLGSDHPDTLCSMAIMAATMCHQGRYNEAETLGTTTLESRKRVLGTEHPDTLHSMVDLAVIYLKQGRNTEAIPLGFVASSAYRRNLGASHPETLWCTRMLGEGFRIGTSSADDD